MIRSKLATVAAALIGFLVAAPAAAQTYPARPVKIVVGFAAGGGTDINARIIGAKLSDHFGQSVVVENRPGAGTLIAAEAVAKSAPDGYTLLLSGLTTYAVNPSLYPKLPYDTLRDFAPVSLSGNFGLVLGVDPAVPVRTLAEFIALAKAQDGKLLYGSAGAASSNQLAMELLMQRAGIRLTHVPYKGSVVAMQDLLAGRIPVMFIDLATGMSQLRAGKIRVIATANRERSSAFPDAPTIAESGLPGYEMLIWQGVVAPAGTPANVIQRLNAGIAVAMADPRVKQKLADVGIDPLRSTPEEFGTFLKAELAKWAEVIRRGKITLD